MGLVATGGALALTAGACQWVAGIETREADCPLPSLPARPSPARARAESGADAGARIFAARTMKIVADEEDSSGFDLDETCMRRNGPFSCMTTADVPEDHLHGRDNGVARAALAFSCVSRAS